MNQRTEAPTQFSGTFDPFVAFNPLAPAGWMHTAWFGRVTALGSEVTSFVAARIKEDVQTQRAFLQCRSLPEVQHVQSEFLQNAFYQYQAEAGKLIEMTGRMVIGTESRAKG